MSLLEIGLEWKGKRGDGLNIIIANKTIEK